MTLRPGQPQDLPTLQQLFVDTITKVCRKDYTPEQIEVWVAGAKNKERWEAILKDQFVRVAVIDNRIAGFATLDNGTYIDMMYVHKDVQGKGVAKTLYAAIETEALHQGQSVLTTQASITAKPFFERIGFEVLKKQVVKRNDIGLVNYKMAKQLG